MKKVDGSTRRKKSSGCTDFGRSRLKLKHSNMPVNEDKRAACRIRKVHASGTWKRSRKETSR